jgi:hypothetical protein
MISPAWLLFLCPKIIILALKSLRLNFLKTKAEKLVAFQRNTVCVCFL